SARFSHVITTHVEVRASSKKSKEKRLDATGFAAR
ncbi:hypothetical protein PC128_g21988, partial [Phytophthora cactorum]